MYSKHDGAGYSCGASWLCMRACGVVIFIIVICCI